MKKIFAYTAYLSMAIALTFGAFHAILSQNHIITAILLVLLFLAFVQMFRMRGSK